MTTRQLIDWDRIVLLSSDRGSLWILNSVLCFQILHLLRLFENNCVNIYIFFKHRVILNMRQIAVFSEYLMKED